MLAACVVAAGAAALGRQPSNRARGEYTMLAGTVRGGSDSSAVYVLDSVNQEVVAVRWNDSRGVLEGVDYRDLGDDVSRMPER